MVPSKIKKEHFSSKIRPDSLAKVALEVYGASSDLRTMDTNIIVNYLDNQIKLREMPLAERLKKGLLK